MAAALVANLAGNVLDLDRQLAAIDKLIADRFRAHRHAPIIASMVGIGDLLGAEFFPATGGNISAFASAGHLAGYAGLAPTPRDSGRRTGNLHRPFGTGQIRYSRPPVEARVASASATFGSIVVCGWSSASRK
jgi:transposase